jgi:hypothetical protein
MARKPTGRPDGRPEKYINWEHFEQLCGFQCTASEIASFLKVDKKTLFDRVEKQYGDSFSTVQVQLAETGLCSLRRYQFALAKKNASMAIHLGKTLLNQREVVINKNETVATQKAVLRLPDNGRRTIVEKGN